MRIAVIAVTLAMASVLLAAGLEKARHFASFVSTLRDLGFARHAPLVAAVVIALELAVAIAILFRPDSRITAAGILVLATSFAAAGVIAIARRETIRCNCFGPYGGRALGKHQLIAFPIWIGGAALISSQPPSMPGLTLFVAAALTLAALRSAAALRVMLQARADRRSAEEMYAWLR